MQTAVKAFMAEGKVVVDPVCKFPHVLLLFMLDSIWCFLDSVTGYTYGGVVRASFSRILY